MKSFVALMQKAFFWLLCITVFLITAFLFKDVIDSLMVLYGVLAVVSLVMMFVSVFTDIKS